MPIGTSEGVLHEDKVAHLLGHVDPSSPSLTFQDRAAPAEEAIKTGTFDPVGGNYTEFSKPESSSISSGQLAPETKNKGHYYIEQGLKLLGIGGNAISLLGEVARSTTGKLFFPADRLHEYRSSPDYQGNKPEGNSMEETEALRRLNEKQLEINKMRKDMGLEEWDYKTMEKKPLPDLPGITKGAMDMAPEGMRIPIARVQQSVKDQYGGGGGGGSFEMPKPANTNKSPADQYLDRVKQSKEYKDLIKERGEPGANWDPKEAAKRLDTVISKEGKKAVEQYRIDRALKAQREADLRKRGIDPNAEHSGRDMDPRDKYVHDPYAEAVAKQKQDEAWKVLGEIDKLYKSLNNPSKLKVVPKEGLPPPIKWKDLPPDKE